MFVVQHVMNVVVENVSKCGDTMRYVDSGASNHMTSHGECFEEMKKPEKPRYVETGDNTTRQIVCEKTLVCKAENANGGIYDCTTS